MDWLTVTVGLAAVFVAVLWLYLTRNRFEVLQCIIVLLSNN